MRFFTEVCASLPSVQELRRCLQKHITPVSFTGTAHIHRAQILLTLSQDAPVLAVVNDEAAARLLCEDINFMANAKVAYPYPAKELNFAEMTGISREYEQLRISALSALTADRCRVLVASAEAALQYTLPPQVLSEHTLTLESGKETDHETLSAQLIAMGYARCEQIDAPCQFSVRGDIFDIFPVQSELPVRIEFWGDEIDSISYFEPETQRRTDAVDAISVAPAMEALGDITQLAANITELAASLRGKKAPVTKELLLADAEKLRNGIRIAHIDKYFPLLYDTPATVFDYCSNITVLCEAPSIIETMRAVHLRLQEELKLLLQDGTVCRRLIECCLEPSLFTAKAEQTGLVCMNTFFGGSNLFRYQQLLNEETLQNAPWGGSTTQLAEDLKELLAQNYAVLVCGGTEKTLPILQEDLRAFDITAGIANDNSLPKAGKVLLCPSGLSGGFAYPMAKVACIAQTKAQNTVLRKRRFKKGQEIRALSEIAEGDLVVHMKYGIGRFNGIEKLEMDGITRDFISIQYAGTDSLYIPVTHLDQVSRYIGGKDDTGVKLNKLSSPEWQKTRSNVKKAVKDMAAQLIKLYAAREQAKGFAFERDDTMQRDFEERFPYAETDDQLRSIEEIKKDMERDRPMDRLLCGDVGFGKTEVAFRAALKCVLSGKQCAILAPTTVLAYQHYTTAQRRFESIPLNIELLSRFRTKKQQNEVLKKLASGQIDIIIGTHRLIQQDVKFAALGLAIIDEEQRFGVAHKERFKEAFHGIDILTLSATPIPRTLNMALSGIRDMSVLEEPPQDRYPVQSYVLEYTEGIIAQAIQRELKRGGQVYYLHNRVDTIQKCAAKLQEMAPTARIAYAHGKMNEQEISEIWRQLMEHEIDILVCTTIIETGVDVPNANTLILENADRFGLSQLYQLRGRVGRSNRRAYAYFTYEKNKSLNETAEKRLDAIREFTQFGSGFRIAMRDLELRGAGSILGGQQHGQMEQVGYEMYMRMLTEAIAEEKGEAPPTPSACTIDIQMEAHIPETYIESMTTRLEIYRRVALIGNEADKIDMIDELIDRFGDPPKSMMGLLDAAMLRNMAAQLGVQEISQKRGALFFYIPSPTAQQISAMMQAYYDRIAFNDRQMPYFIAVRLKNGETAIGLMKEILEILAKSTPKASEN